MIVIKILLVLGVVLGMAGFGVFLFAIEGGSDVFESSKTRAARLEKYATLSFAFWGVGFICAGILSQLK